MKNFYKVALAGAAIMIASAASAQDLYLIGGNVDGESWALGTNQMTANGDGTYSWKGDVLATGFKINDGTWDNGDLNIGAGEGQLVLGQPYTVSASGDSSDINFADDIVSVTDVTVEFDLFNMSLVVKGTPVYPDPDEIVTLYVIGGNVDGENWALGTNPMEYNATDKNYVWKGSILGEGFKINDGTWAATYNIGSSSKTDDLLTLGEPFKFTKASNSQDIFFAEGVTQVEDPIVVVDLNAGTIVVTEANAITSIKADLNGEEVIYSLQGVRVNKANMTPGIYVINGKKTVVK